MNLTEQFRGAVLRDLVSNSAVFAASWSARRTKLNQLLARPGRVAATDILRLGDSLRDVFRVVDVTRGTGTQSEEQGKATGAGEAWSRLVAYYLNAVYAGTPVLAVHSKKFVPKCLKDATTVWYDGATKVDPDLDVALFCCDALSHEVPFLGPRPTSPADALLARHVSSVVEQHISETSLTIVQAKTNWKDNAQVPFLWHLLYQTALEGSTPSPVTIGINHHSIRELRAFSYAFITVPTNDRIGPVPIARVKVLSGGHFWGKPTERNICASMAEFCSIQASKMPHLPKATACGQELARALSAGTSTTLDLTAFDL